MALCERLKIAREALGKNQKEIAALAGASYRAWQGYETGDNQPGAKVIEALTKLGVNANWLFTGEGEILLKEKGAGISQYASGNVGMIQAGSVSGSISQSGGDVLPDDIQELCILLQRYGNKALKDDLKARLLRIKEAVEA